MRLLVNLLLCSNAFSFQLSNGGASSRSVSLHAKNARRELFGYAVALGVNSIARNPAFAENVDVESFIRSGQVAMPMGVSGQAGKMKPETGVILRDGFEVNRDARSGNVLAEILLGTKGELETISASFSSPWPLARGSLFDVECRDGKTGDGAFLSVTKSTGGKSLNEIPDSFFTGEIFKPTGRFSFYGTPTDVKVKKSEVDDDYRFIELSFSSLSQSTMTEIPRRAIVAATIPKGTDKAVLLVTSVSSARWRKGSEDDVRKTASSFRAVPAPKTGLKVRAKEKS